MKRNIDLDVLIIGGGIAGLWLRTPCGREATSLLSWSETRWVEARR